MDAMPTRPARYRQRRSRDEGVPADARLSPASISQVEGDAVSVNMSQAEREAFLAGVHVGVLTVVAQEGRGPLATPVWYSYSPGGLVSVTTGATSRKARAVAAAGRFSLCAQDEAPPYKYVTVEGPAVMEPAEQAERIAIARRYLGTEGGDAYIAANLDVDDVTIRMTPEHWQSADFSKAD
jgi:PPOX class probable F420-dependent enzyme